MKGSKVLRNRRMPRRLPPRTTQTLLQRQRHHRRQRLRASSTDVITNPARSDCKRLREPRKNNALSVSKVRILDDARR